jgi:hypothetical protein
LESEARNIMIRKIGKMGKLRKLGKIGKRGKRGKTHSCFVLEECYYRYNGVYRVVKYG